MFIDLESTESGLFWVLTSPEGTLLARARTLSAAKAEAEYEEGDPVHFFAATYKRGILETLIRRYPD